MLFLSRKSSHQSTGVDSHCATISHICILFVIALDTLVSQRYLHELVAQSGTYGLHDD